jgi:hypothetical protein
MHTFLFTDAKVLVGPNHHLIEHRIDPDALGRRSTAVVQRFCKPKVGSSILSAGTIPSRPVTELPRRAVPVMRELHGSGVLQ